MTADVLLALLVVLLLFPTSVWPSPADDDRALDVLGWLLMLIPAAALLFRRSHPQIALAVGTVLGVFTIIALMRDPVKELFTSQEAPAS